MFNVLILIIVFIKSSTEDINVLQSDCDSERYDFINTFDSIPTKNLIFESNLQNVKFVLNCTFCDHIMNGRALSDGKWYLRKNLPGKFERITKDRFPGLEVLNDNRLKINDYRKHIGFYSCHPDNSVYSIRVITLIDHIKGDKNLIQSNRFAHREEFSNHSIALIDRIETEIVSLDQKFKEKYKILYDYYKDTACSRCNEIGIKDMVYKCRFSELSYLKADNSPHIEPSISCESLILKHYNSHIFRKVQNLPIMSFKATCYVGCDAKLPNLNEISITEKPGILTVLEDDSRKFLRKILMRSGIYPVPNYIRPDYNLTRQNVTVLVERSLKLTCPIDKLEDKSFVFWYFNHTLLSSLKLRIMTDNACRIKKGSLIFDSMQPEYNGSYICTYMTSQRTEYTLNVEKYSSFDLRDPVTVYLVTVYVNFFIFLSYHAYQFCIIRRITANRPFKRKKHIKLKR